jgi:peptide deformylase
MVLPIVMFGTPVLRKKGARIESVTPTIKKLIGDMLETMYAYKGIGLAAQQVGVPVQLTVIDVRGVTDRPSSLELDGKPVEVAEYMPLVLINPDITRPDVVDVQALDEEGRPLQFRCGGLLARAAQHETDHLNGILFIDRMDKKTKEELRPELEDLQAETKARLKS